VRPTCKRLALPLLVLLLAGCSPSRDVARPGLSPASRGDDGARVAHDLRVALDRGDGSDVEQLTLVCDLAASGTHPAPQQTCEHLERLGGPFEPLPDDVLCTEQYGGPQTAQVTGRWQGRPVDLLLSRVDGCRIAQWDRLGPLLPGPVGAEPGPDAPR
jgi:hypothetical protein